jgi:OmpA-OmpF porin, OOP family
VSNLFDLVKSHFGDELVGRLLPFLGINQDKAHVASDSVISTLIGGLVSKAHAEGGADSVFDFLKPFLGSKFDFAKEWSPSGGIVDLVSKGHPMLASLFGDNVKEVTASVGKAVSIPDHEAGKLLRATAPGLMGAIGGLLGANASKTDLMGLLTGQLPFLEGKLPAGLPFDLSKVAGLAGLGAVAAAGAGLADGRKIAEVPKVEMPNVEVPKVEVPAVEVPKIDAVAGAALAGAAAVGAAAVGAALNSSNRITVGDVKVPEVTVPKIAAVAAPVAAVTGGGGSSKAIGWGFGLLALAAFGYLGYTSLAGGEVNVPALPTVKKMEAPVEAPAAEVPKVEAPAAEVPEVKYEGAKMDGIEGKLVEFIKSDKPVDKKTWFTFDRLYFDTAKSSLKPESKSQLKNIAMIMKEYPKVSLKVGGYTDNVGSDASNMKLSGERANVTVKALVALGVEAGRLKAEGFGKQFPIADNKTDAGKAKNRRIDVRVTAK